MTQRRSRRSEGEKARAPIPMSDVVAAFLKQSGLEERIDQAGIIPEWNALVGDPIARVTMPVSVSRTGILLVAVRTNAWMTELSLLEPQLLRELNRRPGGRPVRKIRWRLMER